MPQGSPTAKDTLVVVGTEMPKFARASNGERRSHFDVLLEEARKTPGQVVELRTYDTRLGATSARRTLEKNYPANEWEFGAAPGSDGRNGVFAKFKG